MTGVLAAGVVLCLLLGRMPVGWIAALSVLAGLLLLAGHAHGGVLTMDVYAHRSRLSGWNAPLKMAGSAVLLVLCVASPGARMPLILALVLCGMTAWGGGLGARRYLALLRLPAVFMLLSALALLWTYAHEPEGLLSIPCFGGWLVVTGESQAMTGLVLARAVGAVSCLYFLSLTTPVPEVLSVLRRLRMPGVLLDLAILIYRYIFILQTACREMRDAAASRLGYDGLARSLRTTGMVYGRVLAKSFRRAGTCFDAMESRCCGGEICFFPRSAPPRPVELWVFAGLMALSAGLLAAEIV